jgi:hypothetical protein
VEEVTTQAIEQSALAAGVAAEPKQRDTSPEAVAARLARIQQIVDEIAAFAGS